jgi:hypothetical protein
MSALIQNGVRNFLSGLTKKGVQVNLAGQNLHIKAHSPISSEITKTLKARKPEIVRMLQMQETVEEYRRKDWVKIFSTYLNSALYLIRDESVIVPDPTLPKYAQAELEALGGLDLSELKTLHQAKLIFNGTIHRNDNNKMKDV